MPINLRRDTDGAIRNLTGSNVNLILFQPEETGRPLPRDDRRARHLLEVLRRNVGDSFDAGVVNGAQGKGVLTAIGPTMVNFSLTLGPEPDPLPSITVVVGLPRPQTARDILRDATTLGATSLHFVRTEKTEPSYAASSLWTGGEWLRHVVAGAEQAFDTRVPVVAATSTLAEAISTESGSANGSRIALDNYEAKVPLSAMNPGLPLTVAIGGERGWSARDLRTETAVVAALAILRGRLGVG